MNKTKKLNLLGQLLLFLAALAWGTSFTVLKQTIREVPSFYVVGLRFLASSFILFIIFFKRIFKTKKGVFIRGVVLGLVVAAAYMLQTIGLLYTTPGRNAFLTSLYCVLTPFVLWLLYKKKPKVYNVISAVLCLIGIGLIALSNDVSNEESYTLGNMLTLSCAIFYALQVVFIDNANEKGDDNILTLFYELLTVGLVIFAFSLIFELPKYGIEAYSLNAEQIFKIIYMTLVCTLFAQMAQIIGMKYSSANQAALILSLEAVFGALFSIILGEEDLSVFLVAGFVIVFISVIISELKPDLKKLLKKSANNHEK